MAKIFDMQSEVHESPNRNTFDLTHKVHMTGKAGVIYPFLVHPVVPTDSFDIETGIGVNMMPMWYPTQSNMRFIVHYFYVPYRLLMKDWKNTIQGLEQHEFPYHDLPASWYKTGTLADFLGIPTVLVVPEDVDFRLDCNVGFPLPTTLPFMTLSSSEVAQDDEGYTSLCDRSTVPVGGRICHWLEDLSSVGNDLIGKSTKASGYLVSDKPLPISLDNPVINFGIAFEAHAFTTCDIFFVSTENGVFNFLKSEFLEGRIHVTHCTGTNEQTPLLLGHLTREQAEMFNNCISQSDNVRLLFLFYHASFQEDYNTPFLGYITEHVAEGTNLEISEHPTYCPYHLDVDDGDNDKREKLRSFAARAYEMCYNSYYRNWHGNQPFVVNGETKYNEYLPTDASGADTYEYKLHSRNWELDAYTSCLPSPQQGDAPIISVNSLGTMRIQDPDGTTSTIELRDLNGQAGVEVRSADIANPEHARLATSLTTSGMTISDFRQGNALTRFLEQSLRSGYRYADFIFGHFGKSPSHQELDMPLFLGGFTQNVDVSKISNVSASGDTPLGQFAGTGAGFGVSNHGTKHYFDDYGLVLGLMTLVPDPAYSQVLPKHFTYSDRLDFYFPEFSQLGLQPITYEEFCPIQSFFDYRNGDSGKRLTDTFGYQRPNHEYIWMPDTLHGLFRTTLNGSVVNRRFGSRPELGDDFLRIKPEEVNDIFSVVEKNEDIFVGQIVIKLSATRPFPRVVVSTLGR